MVTFSGMVFASFASLLLLGMLMVLGAVVVDAEMMGGKEEVVLVVLGGAVWCVWLARERAREASGGREERWREAVRGRGMVGGGESGGESGGEGILLWGGRKGEWGRGGGELNCLGSEGEVSRLVPGCRGGKTWGYDARFRG